MKTTLFVIYFLTLLGNTVHAAEDQKQLGAYLGAKDAEHPAWFKESFLDLEEDINDAAAEGKRLVLYFYQPGCPYCAELIQNNFAQKDIVDRMQQKFDLVSINMWGDREVIQDGGNTFTEKTLAEALRVNYTPTMLFFNESKKVALRLDGYVSPERMRVAMDYVSAKLDASKSFVDFVAEKSAAPSSGRLHGEDFFEKNTSDLSLLTGGRAPIAVYFEQKQCSACDALHEKILVDPPTRELAKKLVSVQLDRWSDEALVLPNGKSSTPRQWARELGLSYAPALVFFDTSGKEVMRIEEFLKTFHTQSVFDYVLSKGYLSQPNFQRFISARAEHLREQGIDVDIWSY